MKSFRWTQVAVGAVILITGVGSVHAQVMGAPSDGKTLLDFQRQYSGSKPIVAFEKYQEYRRAQETERSEASEAQPAAESFGISGQTNGVKTFRDFQREYSGTKPVAAFHKYQEYRQAQRAGRPVAQPTVLQVGVTDEFRMRNTGKTLNDFLRAYSFTKPVVGMQKYLEYHSRMNR